MLETAEVAELRPLPATPCDDVVALDELVMWSVGLIGLDTPVATLDTLPDEFAPVDELDPLVEVVVVVVVVELAPPDALDPLDPLVPLETAEDEPLDVPTDEDELELELEVDTSDPIDGVALIGFADELVEAVVLAGDKLVA